MDKKKRNIIIVSIIGVVFVAAVGLACFSLFQGFSAEKYVSAVLEQNIEGDVSAVVSMTKGLTEEAAKKQYENVIEDFLNNVVDAKALPLDETQKKECIDACKKIFKGLNYEVTEEVKSGDHEYKVTVKYQVSDVLTKLKTLLEAEKARVNAKVENCEYRGTVEEIDAQMKSEYASNLAAVLEEVAKTMEDGETKNMTVTVKKGENGLYGIESAQIGEFLIKILDLNANQD